MKELLYLIKKFGYIAKSMVLMINKHKLFFLAPVFFMLALLAAFIYYVGPAVIVSFMYAGV